MMAEYDPPQPLWKRNLAGILDFVLAFTVFAILTARVFGPGRPPTFIAQNPNIKYVSLNGYAFAATIALTIGYFIVLGGSGGTVFQRFFGMKRAKGSDEMREVIKTIVRSDGKRRVQIYRRKDGLFSFVEEKRLRHWYGEPRWRSFPPFAALCDSAEASEQQARAAIGWLDLMR